MALTTTYIVVPFLIGARGALHPGSPRRTAVRGTAIAMADGLAPFYAGVIVAARPLRRGGGGVSRAAARLRHRRRAGGVGLPAGGVRESARLVRVGGQAPPLRCLAQAACARSPSATA